MRGESIFGSGVERETFLALRRKWEGEVDVFPQVPVKTVVGFSRVQALQDENEKQYLLKTEFDYVVCKRNTGVPVLVIEFDGVGGGFSRGLQYETTEPIRVRNRAMKMQAKLRICAQAKIPAVVVALPEQERIGESGHLTVLDGIIGEVLASQIFEVVVAERTFKSVEEAEDLEIQLSLTKNPINREIVRILTALHAVDLKAGLSSQGPLYDRQAEGMVGCHSTVRFAGNEFVADAYVREINCRGFAGYGLAERLSELGAMQKALQASGLRLVP
jgi:Protein of unknown function (DUF2726)